jgi:hypothetical protein
MGFDLQPVKNIGIFYGPPLRQKKTSFGIVDLGENCQNIFLKQKVETYKGKDIFRLPLLPDRPFLLGIKFAN